MATRQRSDHPPHTRVEQRIRLEPHTINGITHMVQVVDEVHVPVAPRDWDATVLWFVGSVTALVTVLSLGWTAVSVGSLLGLVINFWIAVAVSVVFEASWLACKGALWLARYDTTRAAGPRNAGRGALAVAVAAIAAHGWIVGQPLAGAFGAVVPLLANGLQNVTLGLIARPLDERSRQWVEAQNAKVYASLAMGSITRRLNRQQAAIDAEARLLAAADSTASTPASTTPAPLADPAPSATAPAAAVAGPAGAAAVNELYKDPRCRVIRDLYDTLGARPTSGQMVNAVRDAGLGALPSSTARSLRTTIEAVEPALAELPSKIAAGGNA